MTEHLKILKPRKALNKAFLKIKPNRTEIESFKQNLIQLLDRANETESEEFHKNLVSDFLKKTYYEGNHFINTKGRNDLVIHTGNSANDSVGVIIEAKKPTNKAEMLTKTNLNVKAFQELVLYYLRERITHKNVDLKFLVATNIYEWYIFDAQLFEKLFAQNKDLVHKFNDFEAGRLAGKTTDFFYKEIAEPFIKNLDQESDSNWIEFTFFDFRDYEKPLRNIDRKDDSELISLFKLLSPEHLLKLPFANDSNNLDKRFYGELLHIIGLSETKEGGKKLIERNKSGERNTASLLENAIIQIDSLDKISRLPNAGQFGKTQEEKLFNIGLELSITWINRILFLKLLEAQLKTYHKSDKAYEFLSIDKIKNYDDLNKLFFQVLAKQDSERNDGVKKVFEKVPYLNSSLFEPTEIEHQTLFVSNLEDEKMLPIYSGSVLKTENGKKKTGKLNAIEYLLEFLDAYDFSSEGSEDIQEDNKTLINASVLGLIFEKINGYKDGSFFTPGFITMYMCRETIRKAVIQKFNEEKNWTCNTLDSLYNKIEDRTEANKIINSLKICDPAVGSGHFLVSALNEIIAIKNDLRILADRNGNRLKEYEFKIENDELIVADEDGKLFEYNPKNKESQRVQETLFHEKQTIIENCLFGVDINPNSVKICRLRLWIELLKNAYYKSETELETLPNIDINIKCGNSLISRFDLDSDLKVALKNSTWNIETYKIAVDTYRNAKSKTEKREMETLIDNIKSDFRSTISINDPKIKQLNKAKGDILNLTNQPQLFGMTKTEKNVWDKKLKKLTEDSKKLETEIGEIKNNKIYENAFEWRFEFPEVLNDNGDFVGFDVVIGNPPYVSLGNIKNVSDALSKMNYETFYKTGDLYVLFCERANAVLKQKGNLSFIIPNKWMSAGYGKNLRKFLISKTNPTKILDFEKVFVFDEAVVFVCIIEFSKENFKNNLKAVTISNRMELLNFENEFRENAIEIKKLDESGWQIVSNDFNSINEKIEKYGTPLKNWEGIGFYSGIKTGLNEAFVINKEIRNRIIEEEPEANQIIKKVLRGRNIKRFNYRFDNIYLLFVPWHFPLHNDLSISNSSEIAENLFKKDFPLVYNHLSEFELDLKNRNKVETGIRYEWYALQRHGASYSHLFEEDKIVWMEISDKANYAFDDEKMYITNSAYFLTGHSLKYLLAVLNSKVCDFYFFQKTATIAGGRKRYTKQYVEQNPIPIISVENQKPFIEKVDQILNLKKEDPSADTSVLENEIDQMVYQLYGLTEDEIVIVEAS